MNIKMLKMAFAGLLLSVSGFANAGLIEYIYTGTGTGTIDGQAFDDSFFTITEYSNTDDIQSCGGLCVFIDSVISTISIENVGVFEFITGTRTFLNNEILGFSRAGSLGSDLFNIFNVGSFDLVSNFGPIVGDPELIQWDNSPVMTSGGVLSFASGVSAGATFEARLTTVPESSTIAILILGIMGLASRRFKK
jgi:hypothetical protein